MPTPFPSKDPSKAPDTNTEPNNTAGPGPDTNNGVGAQESAAGEPYNSDSYSSYEEYRRAVEENDLINRQQREGNDPNIPTVTPLPQPPSASPPPAQTPAPSAPPPSPTPSPKVDNNGDSGTGNGSIDNPSTTPSHDEPVDGSPISSESDGAWGGPPD